MSAEDPNIATLRDYVRQGSVNGTTEQQDEEALRALQALASTLAERSNELAAYQRTWGPLVIGAEPVKCLGCYNRTERITELEATLAERGRRIAGLEQRLLDAGLQMLRGFAAEAGAPQTPEDEQHRSQFMAVIRAAESWQRLQWRPASEAPMDTTVLVILPLRVVTDGTRLPDDRWIASGALLQKGTVLGWLPLDVLPALPGGDDEEAPYVCPGCHAVAPERCLPGCIDDAIETELQDALMRGDYDDRDEDGGDDNG